MRKKMVLTVMVVAVLSACSSTEAGGGASGDVWSAYSPMVRERIESMEAASDCAGLQAEFDQADENNELQMERTGRNNADLMGYLISAMERLGCQ